MASKMVSDRRKDCVRVAGSALDQERAERAMKGMMARFADVLPDGKTEITVAEAQIYLGQQLEHMRNETVRRDNDHLRELLTDHEIRVQRDSATAELYGKIFRVRNLFEGQYGPGSSIKIFGPGNDRVPTDPTRLHQFVQRAIEWLTDPEFVPPPGKLEGVDLDPAQLVASFAEPLSTLGWALDALGKEQKVSVDSLVEKNESLGNLGRLTDQGARFLEALFDLAGMEGHADRVRLTSHTGSGEPSDEAPPAGEAPTEEAAAEETAEEQAAEPPGPRSSAAA